MKNIFAGFFLALTALQASASVYKIVDITGTGYFTTFSQSRFTGQSFTVSNAGLLTEIGLDMINMNRSSLEEQSDEYLTLELLLGNGLGGSVIGQSTVNVNEILRDSTSPSTIGFFQSSKIPLKTGEYTFRFIASSMRYGVGIKSGGHGFNWYSGGRGYWFDPLVDGGANSDLAFLVAVAPASATLIPTPPSILLFAGGLLVLFANARYVRRTRTSKTTIADSPCCFV